MQMVGLYRQMLNVPIMAGGNLMQNLVKPFGYISR
jgi:hypothetical protein